MIILRVCRALVNLFGPVAAYQVSVSFWSQTCPYCAAAMVLDGGFVRITPRELGPFRVQQVSCPNAASCPKPGPKKEGLIPSWLLPYQQRLAVQQQEAVAAVEDGTCTIEQAAESIGVEPKTMGRWTHRFVQTVLLFDRLICMLLAATKELSFWIVGAKRRGCSAGRQFIRHIELLCRRKDVHFFDCALAFLSWLWPRAFLPRRQTVRSVFAPEFLS